jgi:uncharacterized hydrophobic protein (TIGR00271 family)
LGEVVRQDFVHPPELAIVDQAGVFQRQGPWNVGFVHVVSLPARRLHPADSADNATPDRQGKDPTVSSALTKRKAHRSRLRPAGAVVPLGVFLRVALQFGCQFTGRGRLDNEQAEQAEPHRLYLIHDSSLDEGALEEYSGAGVVLVTWAERDTPPRGSRVLLCLGDERIRELVLQSLEKEWEMGVLPHREATQAMTALGVEGDPGQLIERYGRMEAIEADALTCNDELVFNSVVIGRVLALRPRDINKPQTRWSQLIGALKGLSRLRLSPYKVTTAKEREINLAALGMTIMGQTRSAVATRNIDEDLGQADGRLSLLALAPRSISSYLWFIVRLVWPSKLGLARLPPAVGLVQSSHVHITSPKGIEYLLDGKPIHAPDVDLKIQPRSLRVLIGPALHAREGQAHVSDKETVRLNDVPVEEGARALLTKSLPLFNHATEEEYRGLFVALRESARASGSYKVLMVLSVLLAIAGLYANSAPVIIGAMILAPLMAPIVSLAMGLARTDATLIGASLRTLAVGVGLGLACALVVAWIMPLETPTMEMKSRMSPSLLDLMVAIVSGIAGAYASAKEEVAKSLAGVAIAVALVPPLTVAGIALGWGEWAMAGGALLLLVTNLAGIAAAGSVTFLVMGFAPFKRAKAGLGISLLIVLVISAPLSLSFSHLVARDRILEMVPRGEVRLEGVTVTVRQVQVSIGEPHVVRLVMSSAQRLDESHVEQLKSLIAGRTGEQIVLEAQFNIRR